MSDCINVTNSAVWGELFREAIEPHREALNPQHSQTRAAVLHLAQLHVCWGTCSESSAIPKPIEIVSKQYPSYEQCALTLQGDRGDVRALTKVH